MQFAVPINIERGWRRLSQQLKKEQAIGIESLFESAIDRYGPAREIDQAIVKINDLIRRNNIGRVHPAKIRFHQYPGNTVEGGLTFPFPVHQYHPRHIPPGFYVDHLG